MMLLRRIPTTTLLICLFTLAGYSSAQDKPTPVQLLSNREPDKALAMMQQDRSLIKQEDPKNHCQPIHVAAQHNYVQVLEWLLANGADINAQAYNRLTPLDFAT